MDVVENNKAPARKNGLAHCGVPQCNNYRSKDVFMYHIPLHVKKSPQLLKEWSITLKMKKDFPNHFLICSRHFNKKHILIPLRDNKRFRTRLAHSAFPCLNLPKSTIASRLIIPRLAPLKDTFKRNASTSAADILLHDVQDADNTPCTNSGGVQLLPLTRDKCTQVNVNPYVGIVSLWDTDKKLNTMTGIPTYILLTTIVEICEDIRKNETCVMSMKDRILMTMFKLKSNCSWAELAIWFQYSTKTVKTYFGDTIQLLAKGLAGVTSTRVQVKKKMARPLKFKVFSGKVDISIIPYIDNIMTIICGLSNLTAPSLSDDWFL